MTERWEAYWSCETIDVTPDGATARVLRAGDHHLSVRDSYTGQVILTGRKPLGVDDDGLFRGIVELVSKLNREESP